MNPGKKKMKMKDKDILGNSCSKYDHVQLLFLKILNFNSTITLFFQDFQ